MNRKTEDHIISALAILFWVVLIGAIVGGTLLFRAKAPCGFLNLLPAKDVPGRCLTVTVQDGD